MVNRQKYLLLVLVRKGLLWACKLQAEAPGHTDTCDLPLTFSRTSAGAGDLAEVCSPGKHHTQNSSDLSCVARPCFSAAGTEILSSFFLNLSSPSP